MSRTPLLACLSLLVAACAPADVRGGGAVSVGTRGGEVVQARDTVAWTMRELRRDEGRCERYGVDSVPLPCLTVAISWPEFTAGPDAIRDSAAAFVAATAFAGADDRPRSTADSVSDEFVRSYASFAADTAAAGLVGIWSLEREVRVACNAPGRLSLRARQYEYTGGAHGMEEVRLATFDVSGRRVRWTDLVTDSAAVTGVAERLFRRQHEIPPGQTLSQAGFDLFEGDTFALTANFHLCRDTLTFRYDAYEIAPYALGPTELLVPMREIRQWVRRP